MGGRHVLVLGALAALVLWLLLRDVPRAGVESARGPAGASATVTAAEAPRAAVVRQPEEALAAEAGPAGGARARAELEAEPLAWVLGTVVDAQGRPVAGARVTLFDGALFDEARSDEARSGEGAARAARERMTLASASDGRFRFPVSDSAGRFGVRVEAAGFVTKSRDQSPAVDAPFELTPAVRAHGRILGEGASQARVFRHAERGAPERVDDGAGRWAAEGLALGRSTSFELVPVDAAPRLFELEPSEPGELVHDLELGELRRFTGRVVDLLTRQPIEGVVLASLSALDAGRLDESDATGAFEVSFRIPSEEGEPPGFGLTLQASAPGYLVASLPLPWLARTGELELVPTGTLAGRVLDGAGRPVAGARLAWLGPFYLQDARLGNLSVAELAPVFSAEDGSFRLDGVPCAVDGSQLEVVHGSTHVLLPEVAPARPDVPRVLEVRLGRGRTLLGQLCWEEAELVPRADLAARFSGAPDLAPPAGRTVLLRCADGERSTVSDARGAFRFEGLPPGRCVLSLASERVEVAIESAAREGELAEGDSLEQVLLEVPLPRRTVRGFLREPDGSAAAQVELFVRLARVGSAVEGARHSTRTDAAGAFALEFPDLSFLSARLVLERGAAELWCSPTGDALDWTLPALVAVELELPGAPPGLDHWLTWDGPGAGEGGRSSSRLRFLEERVAVVLPRGELTLDLQAENGARFELRAELVPGPEPRRLTFRP